MPPDGAPASAIARPISPRATTPMPVAQATGSMDQCGRKPLARRRGEGVMSSPCGAEGDEGLDASPRLPSATHAAAGPAGSTSAAWGRGSPGCARPRRGCFSRRKRRDDRARRCHPIGRDKVPIPLIKRIFGEQLRARRAPLTRCAQGSTVSSLYGPAFAVLSFRPPRAPCFARGCPVWVHDVLKRRAQSNAVPIGAQIVAVCARWADGEKATWRLPARRQPSGSGIDERHHTILESEREIAVIADEAAGPARHGDHARCAPR